MTHFRLSKAEAFGVGGFAQRLDEIANDAPDAETEIVSVVGPDALAFHVAVPDTGGSVDRTASTRRVIRHITTDARLANGADQRFPLPAECQRNAEGRLVQNEPVTFRRPPVFTSVGASLPRVALFAPFHPIRRRCRLWIHSYCLLSAGIQSLNIKIKLQKEVKNLHTGFFTGFVVSGFSVALVLAGPGCLAVLRSRATFVTRLLLLVVVGSGRIVGFRLAAAAFSRRFTASRFVHSIRLRCGREASRAETESIQETSYPQQILDGVDASLSRIRNSANCSLIR